MQWSATQFREIALQGWRLAFFRIATIAATLLLAAAVIQTGAVASFETVDRGNSILRFDRDDALLEDRLGQIKQGSGNGDGISHLRRATELSPLNRRYHFDLASACRAAENIACADREWQLLARLCPMVPMYQSYAAESYLRSNHLEEALAYYHRLLQLDPTYGPASWTALRPVLDPDVIFQRTIDANAAPETKLSYVIFLNRQGNDIDDAAAFGTWKQVVAENMTKHTEKDTVETPTFPFASAKPYLERLLVLDKIDEADTVWRDLQRLRVVATPVGSDGDNLIFNGDFEQIPLNAGFDWRWSGQTADLAIDFAAPSPYRGAHCLRIDFTVTRNQEYEPVLQFVRVFPNRSYLLEGYVRSEEITSDSGPRLRVSDTEEANVEDVLSPTTVGTTPWHPIHLSFKTGPYTQFVRLSLWRPRGRKFPTEISGTFWLDAVSLRDTGSALSPLLGNAEQKQPQ